MTTLDRPERPSFGHVLSMTDGIGMFEHADHADPRREHGYCTDDVARLLIVVVREPDRQAQAVRRSRAHRVAIPRRSQGVTGRTRNRRDDGWTLARSTRRRGLLGAQRLGLRYRRPTARPTTGCGRARLVVLRPRRSQRSPHRGRWRSPRSVPPRSCTIDPATHGRARCSPTRSPRIGPPSTDPTWPWPEPRLSYANAALAEVLIAGGQPARSPRRARRRT